MAPPLRRWKLKSRNNLTHDVFELKFEKPNDFVFQAGQYLSIVIPGAGPGGRNLRRAYSIASAPQWPEIELCIKLVENGPGTKYLNSLRVGDEIEGQAPFGNFCLNHDQNLPVLFIGTGTGVAPLRGMILSTEWVGGGPVGFLLGVRHEQDIIYSELFQKNQVVKNQQFFEIALSRPSETWKGFHGRVTNYIKNINWDFTHSHYYLCGSGAMITEVKDWLMKEKNVTKEQIHTEKYF